MMGCHIHTQEEAPLEGFRTGVSLHGHTLYSRESLDFVYKALLRVPGLAAAVRMRAGRVDLSRGWWTPPLGPRDAWQIERSQIESLDLKPLVSLTDHDDMEAPFALRLLAEARQVPLAFEWTVPFGPTFFHLGVHNLPARHARTLFAELQAYRADPGMNRLGEILSGLAAHPGVLVVFNHPLWDEKGIGAEKHQEAVGTFLRLYGWGIHALEVNGLRPWSENRTVCSMRAVFGKPVISGGDRHALEPNAVLNLTNASGFAEFVEEVREGQSHILVLRHYREPWELRIARNTIDILRTYEWHAKGWRTWSDRAFYTCDDGTVRSFTELIGPLTRAPLTLLLAALQFASAPHLLRLVSETFMVGNEAVL